MRLSEWRKKAPNKVSMTRGVVAVIEPMLVDLGAEADPECWVNWGDDPEMRYSILIPAPVGLISAAVRPSDAEGPRATARLIRWPKLTVSELSIEASGGHRMVAVQVESFVLKGIDDDADMISQFVGGLIGSIDGRNQQFIPIAVVPGLAAQTAVAATPSAGAAVPAGVKVRATPGKPVAVAATPRSTGAGPKASPKERTAASRPDAGTKSAPKSVVRPAARQLGLVPVKPKPAPARSQAAAARSQPVHASLPAGTSAADKPPATTPAAADQAPADHTAPATPLAAHVAAGKKAQPREAAVHQPEPEPDRSEWIGPHPIEPPAGEPKRPARPWMP